jgi:ribosomal-protein-alanine N-acetyltransferase
MAALIQRAYQLGSRWLTLEVRPSNDVAVRLYEKFGFKVIGRRRGYYTDNNEDAIVMWSDSIQAPGFKKRFNEILQTLEIEGLDTSTPQ